jgi:hypothetical protein
MPITLVGEDGEIRWPVCEIVAEDDDKECNLPLCEHLERLSIAASAATPQTREP